MYCTKCGNKAKNDDRFCGKCGAPISDEADNNIKPVNIVESDNSTSNNHCGPTFVGGKCKIICPNCGYERSVLLDKTPINGSKLRCPQCRQEFIYKTDEPSNNYQKTTGLVDEYYEKVEALCPGCDYYGQVTVTDSSYEGTDVKCPECGRRWLLPWIKTKTAMNSFNSTSSQHCNNESKSSQKQHNNDRSSNLRQASNKTVFGWKNYFFRLLIFTSSYSALWLIIVPQKPMQGMKTKAGEIFSLVIPAMFMYIIVHLVVSAIVFFIYIIANKRDTHVTNVFAKALVPSFIISLLIIWGNWYAAAH